ncbi:MAG: hypothetical protein ACK44W_13655, partial [Planctomycetota bacterium]
LPSIHPSGVGEGKILAQPSRPWKTQGSAFPFPLRAALDAPPPGVRIVAFDVTLDGLRYGQWFDATVEVRP